MRWYRRQHLVRVALILLMALNVVPEALAAFPVCNYEFGPVKTAVVGTFAGSQAVVRHSHDVKVVHDCVATTPDRQTVSQQTPNTPAGAAAVLSASQHPAAMLAAWGPAPRGSPAHGNNYLAQRSSVLLLI